MVIASHVILSAYGFWLPNDPRGSWSEFVGAWELFRAAGRATKTDSRRSVAGASHNRTARLAAKASLKYPPVSFDEQQRATVGAGFGRFCASRGLVMLACAVLPEHVHLVMTRHRYAVEQAATLLKGAASRALEEAGIHPLARFPRRHGRLATCWSRGEWKVFLTEAEHVARAVEYVEQNPIKEGLPQQRWPFVRDWREYLASLG